MLEKKIISGNIIAHDVSFEEWMEKYAEDHTEWVEGVVIKMSPVTLMHVKISRFLIVLLSEFLKRTGMGQLLFSPFVMKIKPDSSAREPDLQIVLNEHASIIQETMVKGAADVVIEIVSKESQNRDLVDKYEEYEKGGVREYWIFNPLRKQVDFYALGDDELYKRIEPKDGVVRSTVLRDFSLNTALIWDEDFLQDDDQIRGLVDAMLKKDA